MVNYTKSQAINIRHFREFYVKLHESTEYENLNSFYLLLVPLDFLALLAAGTAAYFLRFTTRCFTNWTGNLRPAV